MPSSSGERPRSSGPSGRAGGDQVESAAGALQAALRAVGLDETAAAAFGDAAQVVGAFTQRRSITDLTLGFTGASAKASQAAGARPRADAAPGSMEAHLHAADVALGAIEAIAACSMRLDAALVMASATQSTATGRALLAEQDVTDPDELAPSVRDRWRSRTKSRTRAELPPAIGWTPGESAHVVALANAPAGFSVPVVTQMARGLLPWRLARSLWLACERMDAADACHVATVMCADDPDTCVPERLGPDGTALDTPWDHRAFYTALAREVAKLTHADDADPDDAEAARAARDAAFAGRRVLASVDEDGTGTLTIITSALWVAAIKDRLARGASAARGAGDERTVEQLQSDIARALLAHASPGFADLPLPERDDDGEITTDDLLRAGWTPELVTSLSGLPSAVLQVIVPLLGLHDPAAADTLPTTGRVSLRRDPNTPPPSSSGCAGEGGGAPGDESEVEGERDDVGEAARARGGEGGDRAGSGERGEGGDRRAPDDATDVTGPGLPDDHTGRPGCPACLPSVRTGRTADEGEHPAQRSNPAYGEHSACGKDPARDRPRVRRLWVGEVLGDFSMFVSPSQVRALALAPGTTLSRLLIDPADGRCIERTITAYQPDAAMRAQLLAADVTCRAPACHHSGTHCQVDHVIEFGTPGGVTSETNGQHAHIGHHDPKTAKHWDAELHANRDVTWTTLLGRIYRTRTFDYRRYVTLLVDAIDTVTNAPPQDRADELNRQVYLALTHRDLDDDLNIGDDDLEPDITRFEGWPFIHLTHRDPATGRRAPGASATATAEALARRATSQPPVPPPSPPFSPPTKPETKPQTKPQSTAAAGPGRAATSTSDSAAPLSTHEHISSTPTAGGATTTRGGSPRPGDCPAAGTSHTCPADSAGRVPGWQRPRDRDGRASTSTSATGRITRLTAEEKIRRQGWHLVYDEGIPPF